MAWTPLLLALLSHCTGSLSQPVLTQPPSLSASPGASVRLTCMLSSGFNLGSYRITWYQQKPGSPPRYLLNYYSDSDKGQGSEVPSRFSGSKDASANAGLLLISGLQPEDEAVYYCATGHSSGSSDYYAQCLRGRGSETKTPGPRDDNCLPLAFSHRSPPSVPSSEQNAHLSPKECQGSQEPVPGPGAETSLVVTQPPSLSASPGATARLTCTLKSGYNIGTYHICWFQQKPGSPPRFILRYKSDSDKHQGSGVPSRFSGSKDASANAGLLTISGLQPEDEADYYCNIWDGSYETYTVVQTHREVRQNFLSALLA
ncbi:hypothetical protein QTO34_011851 [Cnephaeus nilssonii]|uniref:Ig-like domain-containing protein n=1 Tax=Cnephaeus nilssonii TaxID=3371016 RepID=A0AA40HBQ2_CNENI|nr:hypothetical protein QTO34_011851 [Eptesicus nilssonii]